MRAEAKGCKLLERARVVHPDGTTDGGASARRPTISGGATAVLEQESRPVGRAAVLTLHVKAGPMTYEDRRSDEIPLALGVTTLKTPTLASVATLFTPTLASVATLFTPTLVVDVYAWKVFVSPMLTRAAI